MTPDQAVVVVAVCLAVLAIASIVGLGLMVGQNKRITQLERDVTGLQSAMQMGINRVDLDKLHHRVNVLVEKVGGIITRTDSIDEHVKRLDHYMRSVGK